MLVLLQAAFTSSAVPKQVVAAGNTHALVACMYTLVGACLELRSKRLYAPLQGPYHVHPFLLAVAVAVAFLLRMRQLPPVSQRVYAAAAWHATPGPVP